MGEGSWDASGPDFYTKHGTQSVPGLQPRLCLQTQVASARPGCPGMTAVSVRTGPALRLVLSVAERAEL